MVPANLSPVVTAVLSPVLRSDTIGSTLRYLLIECPSLACCIDKQILGIMNVVSVTCMPSSFMIALQD